MNTVDGKQIAGEIAECLKAAIAQSKKELRLAIVLTDKSPATLAFVKKKEEFGARIGVQARVYDEVVYATSARSLRMRVSELAAIPQNDGVIVQLPLPDAVENTQKVLNAVPPKKDADMLSARSVGDFVTAKTKLLPPVVGAVAEILQRAGVRDVRGLAAVVIGAGVVAGRPVAEWFAREGATVTATNSSTKDLGYYTRVADIVVSTAGSPGILRGDMIKNGVIIVDVGTTSVNGKLKGDVDFESCAPKAKFITPVPGGVGPIVVAKVFENLAALNDIELP